MKNEPFKTAVSELFAKTAFGQDPAEVLGKLPAADQGDLRRGLALWEGLKGTGSAVKDIAGAAYRGAGKLLSPTPHEGVVSRGLQSAADFASKRPGLTRAAIGTAVLAPILGNAFLASQKNHEAELMNAYADPSRVITASLDQFLEKKAELHYSTYKLAAPKMDFGGFVREGLGKGIGTALGGSVATLLAHALGSGFSALQGAVSSDPKRKALVESLLKSDTVLSDAVKRHPETRRMVDEAYGTMVKFAPTLSMDINAVRSFLREAVLGGAGVNYATIKNLVDTERSIADSGPKYGRK